MEVELRIRRVACVFVVLVFFSGLALAQEAPEISAEEQAMMKAWRQAMAPGPQHAEMAKMVGEFNMTVKSYMEPGGEPDVTTGTASRKMIMGGRYLEETVTGTVMGEPFEGRGLTGYNNVTGKWWGIWLDNMSTGISLSDGEWDFEKGVGVFYGDYINPLTKEIEETRGLVTQLDGGDELMEMFMITPTGEYKSMEILYERK